MRNPQSTIAVLSSVPYRLSAGPAGYAIRGAPTSQHQALASAIASLEPLQRTVLMLVYLGGQRQAHVAEQLNLSTATVAHATSRGLQSVAHQLEAHDVPGGETVLNTAPADAPPGVDTRKHKSPRVLIPKISRAV